MATLRIDRARARERIEELHAAIPVLDDRIREAKSAAASAQIKSLLREVTVEREGGAGEVKSFLAALTELCSVHDAIQAREERVRALQARVEQLHASSGARGVPPSIDRDFWGQLGLYDSTKAGWWFDAVREVRAVVSRIAPTRPRGTAGR